MLKIFLYLLLVYSVKAQLQNDNPIAAVIHKTLKATARSCMEAVNATEDDLEDLRKDPPFPHNAACILTCLLEKIGIVKDNKFSKYHFILTITPLVIQNRKKMDHMISVAEKCEKEIKESEDSCQIGNEVTVCVFKYAPELHFKS